MKLLEEKLWGVEQEELTDMVGLCQLWIVTAPSPSIHPKPSRSTTSAPISTFATVWFTLCGIQLVVDGGAWTRRGRGLVSLALGRTGGASRRNGA